MRNGKMNYLKRCVLGTLVFLLSSTLCTKAQNLSVSGTVTDDTGQPVIGASVKVPGSSVGTITDMDGNFTISVPKDTKLEVSYVGYKNRIVTASSSNLVISLIEDANLLNEVVAIGYGSVKRKDVTGSVSSVGNADLVAVPVASPVEAMQGKLAGVRVTLPEGNPDAEIIVRVRGGGSITRDNTPLYIVDGFPVSSISDIPASDIETIDVLKDASSTAIYGSRGSNGIILVTTKSGKAGKVVVNYNAYIGFKKAADKVDVLDLEDYLKWQYELSLLASGSNHDKYQKVFGGWDDISKLSSTLEKKDWQHEVYGRTGNVFSHNLNISGGSEKLRFTVGYNYINEKEILLTSDYNRNNLSLKLNYEPNKKNKLEFSTRYSRTKIYGDGQGDSSGDQNSVSSNSFGRIRHAIVSMPFHVDAEYHKTKSNHLSVANKGGQNCPVPTLYYEYDQGDERRDINCVPYKWNGDGYTLDNLGTGQAHPGFNFGKYDYERMNRVVNSNDDGVNLPVIRYADILLMAAEIANELGDLASAKKYLTMVRQRAFSQADCAEHVTAYINSINGKDAMLRAIQKERLLEFPGEMLRKQDLIRWNILGREVKATAIKMKQLKARTGVQYGSS